VRKFGRSSFAEQGAVYGLLRSTDAMKRMVLSELYRLNSARSLFWWPGADDPLRLQHAIFQSPVDPSPHEVYAALQVLGAMKTSGGLVFLPVGSKPFPDRDLESNRSALASVTSLQHITGNSEISFRADVWCGNADCDGISRPAFILGRAVDEVHRSHASCCTSQRQSSEPDAPPKSSSRA
jgi:hypothetical protein